MTSAGGYELFDGLDPEGSPPVPHLTESCIGSIIGGLILERDSSLRSTSWCLDYCQAYDSATLNVIAQEALEAARGGVLACVCSPGVFLALREASPDTKITLLDFNPLLQDIGPASFAIYDYNSPQSVPEQLHHRFDVVVGETPYPTQECALGILQTMKLLSRSIAHPRLYLTTEVAPCGELWGDLELRPVKFRPRRRTEPHTLATLYTNCRPSQRLIGWQDTS